jgi:hypothetical protein
MNILKTALATVAVAAAVALPLGSASAWWGGGPWGGGPWGGPWGAPGTWGGPGIVPPGVARIPGWSPEEVAEKYDFYGPYGPSITDIRRLNRDIFWGRPLDNLYQPLGPSGTDLRRKERQELLRSLRGVYGGFPPY